MNQKNNSGFTLLFAVLVVGSLLAAVMTITSITFKQLILSSVGRESQVAFFAADMGAECAIYLDNKLDYFYTYEASPLPNEIKCGGGSATGIDRVMTETSNSCPIGSTCFRSEFIFSTDPSNPKAPNASVNVTKNITTRQTRIESLGYNTGDTSNARRVERAIRLTYYQVPRQVCGTSGDTMILIDSSSLPANAELPISDLVGNMFGSLAVNKVGLIRYDNLGAEMLAHLSFEEDVGVLQGIVGDLTLSGNNVTGNLSDALELAQAEFSGLMSDGEPEVEIHNRSDSDFPNYVIVITSGGSDSTVVIDDAADNADDIKSNTGASIYTIAYGDDPSTSGSESLDKRIAGNPANQSSSSGANDPYNEKYSYVAKTPEDLEMVVASIVGCH